MLPKLPFRICLFVSFFIVKYVLDCSGKHLKTSPPPLHLKNPRSSPDRVLIKHNMLCQRWFVHHRRRRSSFKSACVQSLAGWAHFCIISYCKHFKRLHEGAKFEGRMRTMITFIFTIQMPFTILYYTSEHGHWLDNSLFLLVTPA